MLAVAREHQGASAPTQPPTAPPYAPQSGYQRAFCHVAAVNRTGLRSRERRFESCRGGLVVSQDIVDRCRWTSWTSGQSLRLVVAGGVEGELTQERSVGGKDTDVEVGDQDDDFGSGVPS